MKFSAVLATTVLLVVPAYGDENEIGFIEQFALAEDRIDALSQLIPGTDDYYYYHCLHYQNTEQFDRVEALLKNWQKQHANDASFFGMPRVREIRHRQALLTYPANHRATLEYLKRELNVQLNHQRERLAGELNLPRRLDPKLLSRSAFREFIRRSSNGLDGFEERSFRWLINEKLTPVERRALLSRLQTPDYDRLVDLIDADLGFQGSRGFGSLPIHSRLTLRQLNLLRAKRINIVNDNDFVNVYLLRLLPNDHIDLEQSLAEKRSYLERLWKFVGTLPPTYNSLKANVLYRSLELDLAEGKLDKRRLLEYLALPRRSVYVPREYLAERSNQRFVADLNADYSKWMRSRPIQNDEPLVRRYLQRIFVDADSYAEFQRFVRLDYLKELFAETKLLYGLGNAERWFAMIPPDRLQQIKDRVEISFDRSSRTRYQVDDPVHLSVDLKNVPTLLVKVYRINAENFYRQNRREISTDINLDGLIARHEETHRYQDAPIRRVRREFSFPQLDKAGVYIIDFIGNGVSSRALIRKGHLRHVARLTDHGQLVTVLDENGRHIKEARLWMAGREYEPDDEGRILLPFSHQPRTEAIVLSRGDTVSLNTFYHAAEEYSLRAGIYVDRESLLARRQARVVVRPGLYLAGQPMSRTLLENVRVTIAATDLDGIVSTEVVDQVTLSDHEDFSHVIRVPDRTKSLRIRFDADVQLKTTGEKKHLSVQDAFQFNSIDSTSKMDALHLTPSSDGFVLELLGKNGEPLVDRPVVVRVKHREFTKPQSFTLQPDAKGRIALGTLDDIESLEAVSSSGTTFRWNLPQDRHTFHQSLHVPVGETIALPYFGAASQPKRDLFALFEMRGPVIFADRFDALSISDGLLQIKGLGVGDYTLYLREQNQVVRIRIGDGENVDGFVIGEARQLERKTERLAITKTEVSDDEVVVQLALFHPATRLHVYGSRYVPAFDAFAKLSAVRDSEPTLYRRRSPNSVFVEGRRLGDEMQYVLNRRFAKKYPGNMLDRPQVLLNPWAVQDTATDKEQAEAGEVFDAAPDAAAELQQRGQAQQGESSESADFANLDFLLHTSDVFLNRRPDKDGVVRIRRSELKNAQHLTIVAVDHVSTTRRVVLLPPRDLERRDLRLADALPTDKHFSQQRRLEVVDANQEFVLQTAGTPTIELFDSISKVYSLYESLGNDAARLNDFRFILKWDSLTDEQKRARYSEFACHELNFFLFKKDRAFFDRIVRPYLENKFHKTFVDRWLLNHDLSNEADPWAFSQLNSFEQILLAKRSPELSEGIIRLVNDRFERLPDDTEQTELMLGSMLKRGALAGKPKSNTSLARKARTATRQAELSDEFGVPAEPGATPRSRRLAEHAEKRLRAADADEELEAEAMFDEAASMAQELDDGIDFGRYAGRDRLTRQLYRPIDQTKEWAENNYYHLPIANQNHQLIEVNGYWRDFANHHSDAPFYSAKFGQAARNCAEMMMALAVLDLPLHAEETKIEFADTTVRFKPESALIVAYESIRPVHEVEENPAILVSQNFFRADDRYQVVGNERRDKFVTREFVQQIIYGCQIVVTNSGSSRQKLSVLTQLPEGALPVAGSAFTKNQNVVLEPYQTQKLEYYFYFPRAGTFDHYPVHVNREDTFVAAAPPFVFEVVEQATIVDRESWNYISQFGSEEEVLRFLETHNLQGVDLSKIAFRMKERAFFEKSLEALQRRFAYDDALWSYALLHDDTDRLREYLSHAERLISECGLVLNCPLLTIDPVARKFYQHLEYRPLVNARAHQLGATRRILNDRFYQQYQKWLATLVYRRDVPNEDCLAATYYLLLQDRVEEAWRWFEKIQPEKLVSKLQYDYAAAYMSFYAANPERARSIAARYADYPVDRWQKLFANVSTQLDEIEGKVPGISDETNREQQNSQRAATEATFAIELKADQLNISYRNLSAAKVNYYLIDVELLFSRSPFVSDYSNQFSFIEPNRSDEIELPADRQTVAVEIPDDLKNKNVFVEVVAAGQSLSEPYFSNSMDVFVMANYGQLQVNRHSDKRPLPKTYVKVYAEMNDGRTLFYKDGYTDLRGRFDYSSLSTNQLPAVRRFSILVLSEENGAIIRTVEPPKS